MSAKIRALNSAKMVISRMQTSPNAGKIVKTRFGFSVRRLDFANIDSNSEASKPAGCEACGKKRLYERMAEAKRAQA